MHDILIDKFQNTMINTAKQLILIIGLIGTLWLFGCEGYRCAEGTVYESGTDIPIDSVLCKVLTGTEELYTDSLGRYEVCNVFSGCVPDCPEIEVEYSKPGYLTLILTNPNRDDIFLEKE